MISPTEHGSLVVQHEIDRGIYLLFWDSSWIEPAYRRASEALRARVVGLTAQKFEAAILILREVEKTELPKFCTKYECNTQYVYGARVLIDEASVACFRFRWGEGMNAFMKIICSPYSPKRCLNSSSATATTTNAYVS